MSYEIGSIVGIEGYKWQVAGYLCTGDGIQAVGNSIEADNFGMEQREWVGGFNRSAKEVRKQIQALNIDPEGKQTLEAMGLYPANLLDIVGLAHNNWRLSIGKEPNYGFVRLVRGPVPLVAK